MNKINRKTSLKDLAGIVAEALKKHGLTAVLVGGAVVSIYTKNRYKSFDLDFVSYADTKDIDAALKESGFVRERNRYYTHSKTKYFVEFPPPPITIGDKFINKWAKKKLRTGTLELFTPTQSVMDRLAAFYHWNDRQSLEQAVLVAKHQKINLTEIKKWSKSEGIKEKFDIFLKRLKQK